MKNDKSNLILNGNLFHAILYLSLPIMLNNLIGSLYNLGDAFWVSKIGDVEVAAVSFVWPVSFLLMSIAQGISIAGGSIISQYIGAKRFEDASDTAATLYWLALLLGVSLGLLGFFATPTIIHWMGATDALYNASVTYLQILFFELPLVFMMNIYFSINQAQGDTFTPTLLNGSSAIVNIIIDPLFIFTFGMGIGGAAIATVLSKVPFVLFAIYKLYKGTDIIQIHPIKAPFKWNQVSDLVRIGIPSSLGSAGVALGFIMLFVFVIDYGDYAMTAMGIGNRINSLAFMPAVGIGAALSTITGQNLGAGNLKRIVSATKISILLSFTFLSITGFLLWFFSREIVGIFSQTEEVLSMGSTYLRALALTTWSIAFFNCSIGVLNGSGHTMITMFLEAGRLWLLRIPLIYWIGHYTHLGATGLFYVVAISNVVAAAFSVIPILLGVWKKPILKRQNSISFEA